MDKPDALVEFYVKQMLKRYEAYAQRPEVIRAVELLRGADDETVRRVLELLEVYSK